MRSSLKEKDMADKCGYTILGKDAENILNVVYWFTVSLVLTSLLCSVHLQLSFCFAKQVLQFCFFTVGSSQLQEKKKICQLKNKSLPASEPSLTDLSFFFLKT